MSERKALKRSAGDLQASAEKKAKLESEMKMESPPEDVTRVKREELHCIICFDFPTGPIFQCDNGHLLCSGCHVQVLDLNKPVCPTCRVKLDRERPSRNRLAEVVLANFDVKCDNADCNLSMKFGELMKHTSSECLYREAICKYNPIGCDWKGIERTRKKHEKSCPIKKEPAKKLLQNVNLRNIAHEKKLEQVLEDAKSEREVCRLLSSRCRDIAWRDVVIESDPYSAVIASKPFHALGLAWEVHLAHQNPEHPGCHIVLQCISSVRRKTTLKICIMKGPGCTLEMPPCIIKRAFRRKKRKSEPFTLPLSDDAVSHIFSDQSLHLRVGFFDCSGGPLHSSFTSANVTADSDHDSDDSDLSASDNEDHDGSHDELLYDDFSDGSGY